MLRGIALISLIYDTSVSLGLVFLRPQLQTWFGVAPAEPPIHVDLNALFLIAVGLGYLLPFRDPVRYRAYLWVFGVGLKFAGAAAFVGDYVYRTSPAAYLLFAVSDATVGALTLAALRLSPAEPPVERDA